MIKPKIDYNQDETVENIEKLSAALHRLNEKNDLSPEGYAVKAELVDLLCDLEEHLQKFQPQKPLTLQNWGGSSRGPTSGQIAAPGAKKDYKALFGGGGYAWPDKESNFFAAAISGKYHPGLIKNSLNETTPSDGGFLVPVEHAANIHAVSLENEIVMPRCYVQPMQSNEITIPGMTIGSHGSHLFGGFTATYTPEAGEIDENDPKVRAMKLVAKKLTGLIRFSSELQMDTPGGMGQIETICGKGLGWYRDKAFLKGTGAGEPLGILNSPALISVAKESAQSNDTILYENLTKMMAAMYAGSFGNSVWLCHQSTIPQLLQLSMAVGTGGSAIPVLNENNGTFSMLTRPVVFTEKTETLGNKGDIMLVDFSQYVVGLRSEMRFDTSIHVGFTTDEILARLIERHDGQPLWDSALTLEDGVTQVSPFVTLAAR
jgi:HK97 family phage major capsid protein